MKVIILPCLILLIACSQKKSSETTTDSTAFTKDTVSQTISHQDQSPSSVKESTKEFQGKDVSLEELDPAFQTAFSNFHEPVKLTSLIHPKYGCYWIAAGAGVYPVVKEIKSSATLNDCNEYSLFVNQPMLLNGYFVNPQGIDNCNPQTEGVFIFDAKDNQLVYKAYQSQLTATNETMPESKAPQLHSLDAAVSKYLLINVPSKDGELNTFEMYFGLIDGKLYLAAIDTRGCGI